MGFAESQLLQACNRSGAWVLILNCSDIGICATKILYLIFDFQLRPAMASRVVQVFEDATRTDHRMISHPSKST
jgi:hypothetical protein